MSQSPGSGSASMESVTGTKSSLGACARAQVPMSKAVIGIKRCMLSPRERLAMVKPLCRFPTFAASVFRREPSENAICLRNMMYRARSVNSKGGSAAALDDPADCRVVVIEDAYRASARISA